MTFPSNWGERFAAKHDSFAAAPGRPLPRRWAGDRPLEVRLFPAWLMALALLAGCQSSPVLNSEYIAPRVTGKVLNASTHQPIVDASVRRVIPGQSLDGMQTQRGAETLQRSPVARTRSDGSFVLDSERSLALLRGEGWYSVTLAFDHAGFERLLKTYTLTDSTNTPSGEPLIETGDILLKPKH